MNDIINEKMREFFRQELDLAREDSFFSLTTGASIPIDTDEFIGFQVEDGISVPNVLESFSDLVNVLPAYYDDLSKVGADELYSIDDLYYQLLSGSIPKGGGPENNKSDDLTKVFSEKKDAALRGFEEAKRYSTKNWNFVKKYLITEADPESWYKPESVVWKSYSIDVDLHPRNVSPSLLPVFKLKIDNTAMQQLEKKVMQKPPVGKDFFHHLTVGLASPLRIQAVPGTKGKNISIAEVPVLNKGSLKMELRDTRRVLTQVNAVAVKKDAKAKSINISFDYLYVRIDRRAWLDSTFLTDTNWYYPGKSKGSFSIPPNRNGIEPSLFAIPTGMVLIKNLTIISDSWSEDDKNAVSKSISFANFNIQNAKMNGDIIQVPGMQVWGWVSRKLPVLPPQDPD